MRFRSTLKWFAAGALLVAIAGPADAQDASSLKFEALAGCREGQTCGPDEQAGFAQSATAAARQKCIDAGCTCGNAETKTLNTRLGVAVRAIVTGTSCKNAAQVDLNRKPVLNPQEQLSEATASLARMEQAASVVRRQVAAAREARDVVKTLCLNDKLNQIDVAIRAARERKATHAASVARNDREGADHEFAILVVLHDRARQHTSEANQCIGEELSFVGKTEVITQVDPNLPGTDLTDYPPTDPTIVIAPPQCVSCNGKN